MIRINEFEQHIGTTIEGQYTLTNSVERVTQMGDRFKVLNLTDCTGSVRVYAWEHSGLLERIPAKSPSPVQATDATDHRHDIVARRETNISHRASHEPNNNTQEGPFPWI